MKWRDVGADLVEVDLELQGLLLGVLDELVPWLPDPSNFGLLPGLRHPHRVDPAVCLGGLLCQPSLHVGLVLLALGVGEVAPFVGVEGQAEAALIGPEMVLHYVRIFGDVEGLEGDLPESLTSFDVGVL